MTDDTAETLDLSRLPAGDLVTIDYAGELATRKTLLAAEYAALGLNFEIDGTELDPAVKLMEVGASRMMIALQAINDAGAASQLAHARRGNLDQLGANVGCYRLKVGVDSITGEDVMEADERFRRRIQLANERRSTGSRGYYVSAALEAVPTLSDVSVVNPAPGQVVVTAMSDRSAINPADVDPLPTDAEMAALRAFLFREDVKGATHELTVQPADVLRVPLAAVLQLYGGPDPDTATTAALKALAGFLAQNKRLGRDLLMNAWVGRLQTDAVFRAIPSTPLADVVATPYQVVFVPSITVTPSGITGQ